MNKIINKNFLKTSIKDETIKLVIADPPYGLGKDYGNDSDCISNSKLISFTKEWSDIVWDLLTDDGSIYVFASWRHSPEIFWLLKQKFIMINEIIWDRKVPSMGGSTRRFSSVHDNIGLFVKSRKYCFNIDDIRIPYDEETKKARTRKEFAGSKWLEYGYNPKDVWEYPRIHKQDPERTPHPTQKPLFIIKRMILASSNENDIVLDPFAGSGTVALACKQLKRNCYSYEINESYCDIINQRLL